MTLQQEFWVKTTDQQKLYVKAWGEATLPPLVLVHGYPDNQETWERIIPFLTDQFYIITYDVRGAGQSSIPDRVKSYCLPQLADDLESVVNQVIPDRPYHLAAHDWGSIQSWEAVTEPRFRGKILSYSTISGPCLDHAQFALAKVRRKDPAKWLKLLSKSWYIGVFHLPLLAPTFWRFASEKSWQKFLDKLERKQGLPVSSHVSKDGQFGISLYRANFLSALLKPRKRYAQCPVQAIVLKYDRFVSPEYIEEMPHWVDDFSRVEVEGNHWAILSQPEKIANYIATFAQKYH